MTLRYAHLSQNHKKLAVEQLESKMHTIWAQNEGSLERGIDALSLTALEST